MNATAIARAKEAIAAGKKLECSPEADAAKKAKGGTKAATPKAKSAPAAKGATKVDERVAAAALKAKDAAAKATATAKIAADKVKAAEKAQKAKDAAAAKKIKDAEREATKLESAAAYKQRIEDQKAATIKRHRDEKLYNSFRARVKYMLYMDNPALGGLEGREQLGWALKHHNSQGDTYLVERIQDKVHVNQLLKVAADDHKGLTQVAVVAPVEADVLAAMESWVA